MTESFDPGELLDEAATSLYKAAGALSAAAFKLGSPETKQAVRDFLAPVTDFFEGAASAVDPEPEPVTEEEEFENAVFNLFVNPTTDARAEFDRIVKRLFPDG